MLCNILRRGGGIRVQAKEPLVARRLPLTLAGAFTCSYIYVACAGIFILCRVAIGWPARFSERSGLELYSVGVVVERDK